MNDRENIIALLNGEEYERVPIWIQGFDNEDTARRLNPKCEFPEKLSPNPETTDYPWDRISDKERIRIISYNQVLFKPAVVVGWGANMDFGHGGPGEFHFSILDVKENERTLICETGCKRLIKKNPHFYKDFDYPMQSITDLDKLNLPDPHDKLRYKGFADDVKYFKEQDYFTCANLNGFFSAPHYFCLDYQEFLMSTVLNPNCTKKLINKIGEWNISAAEELLSKGVDCITICDDLGTADNLLISPEIYKQLIFPWHKKICDIAHDHGAYVHLHSHGNLKKILTTILLTGVDMLNPFDSNESMYLIDFLENYPELTTIPVGGFHKNFFDWDRENQNRYLSSLFNKAKKTGRWIFMDPSGIQDSITCDNYNYFMEKIETLSKI